MIKPFMVNLYYSYNTLWVFSAAMLLIDHKDAGERMVELTKENKETLNEMQRSQRKMREFVGEKVAHEQRWNMRFMLILFGMFIFMIAIISYTMLSFRSEVSHSIKELSDSARETNGVTTRLYLEQKKFIEENKCIPEKNKKSAETKENKEDKKNQNNQAATSSHYYKYINPVL